MTQLDQAARECAEQIRDDAHRDRDCSYYTYSEYHIDEAEKIILALLKRVALEAKIEAFQKVQAHDDNDFEFMARFEISSLKSQLASLVAKEGG